jgi:protoporphyrinogen oxidase
LRDSLGNPEPGATDLLLPRDTLSALLPDPAAAWLQARGVQIRTRQRIRKLRQVMAGWQLEGQGESAVFDQVIVAVAPQHLSALAPSLAAPEIPDAQNALLAPWVAASCASQSLRFEPIATVYFHYPPAALPFPLIALQDGIGQWLVDRGQGVLAAILSGHGAWEAMEDDALATALHKEIARLLPHVTTDSPPPYHIIKTQRATFSCTPNLQRCPQITPWRGLFIAGDYAWCEDHYPATLESAVRSGLRAARLCAPMSSDNPSTQNLA